MKKILISLILLLISYQTIIFVYSSSKNNSEIKTITLDNGIIETNELLFYKDNWDLKELNISYTIPNDFQNNNISFNTSFISLLSNKSIHNLDNTTLNIYIKNSSKHNYTYMNKSVKLYSDQNIDIWPENDYQNSVSVDNHITIYRPYNSALQSLLNNDDNLTDDNINKKLLELGYNGIDDLLSYYLDFYNDHNETISDNTIYEIFNGKTSNIKESNINILTLGYHWVYDKIITINFLNQKYYQDNPTIYSIGNYMRNDDLANPYFMESFMDILKRKKYSLQQITVNINTIYYLPAFKDFTVNLYLSFSLERTDFDNL